MERRLSAATRLGELGPSGVPEVGDLRGADGADLSSPARVDGVELCGDDGWVGRWGVRDLVFGGEQALHELVLEVGGVRVVDCVREAQVGEAHWVAWLAREA